jgi:hypothetical protein
MKLKYHGLVCEFLGVTPTLDSKAVQAIEKAEAKAGRRLPASIREFYSIRDLFERMHLGAISWVRALPDVLKWFVQEAVKPKSKLRMALVSFEMDPDLATTVSFMRAADPKTCGEIHGEPIPFSELIRETAWYNACENSVQAGTVGPVEVGPPHRDFVAEMFTSFRNYYRPPLTNPLTGLTFGDAYHYQDFHPLGWVELKSVTDATAGITTVDPLRNVPPNPRPPFRPELEQEQTDPQMVPETIPRSGAVTSAPTYSKTFATGTANSGSTSGSVSVSPLWNRSGNSFSQNSFAVAIIVVSPKS